MIDIKICEWLIDNADAPIRYRVARELLNDEKTAKKFEAGLLENPSVDRWLKSLKSDEPLQHGAMSMEHGSIDSCLENAMYKCVRLGLHGGLPQLVDSASYYIDAVKNYRDRPFRNKYNSFTAILSASLLGMAGIEDKAVLECMLGLLDEMYAFAKQKNYDIYISEDERAKLAGVPQNWRSRNDFIKYELIDEYGFCFPLVYDIMGMYTLYGLGDADINEKIDTVLSYISNDDFHSKIADGYGILIADPKKKIYHGMGWSPHYPGWFNLSDYFEESVIGAGHVGKPYIPRLLFFAEIYSCYPIAVKTKWFSELIEYLEKYKTESGTYKFPKEWLPEKTGYAVGGFHMSYGENRRKKNWCEIESTFYMQLIKQKS